MSFHFHETIHASDTIQKLTHPGRIFLNFSSSINLTGLSNTILIRSEETMDHHNRPTHVYLIAGYLTSHGVYNTELTCSINTVEDCTATIISYLFSFALRSSSTLINIHRFEAALAGWTIDIQLLQPMLFASTSITEVQIFFHFPPPEYQFVCLIFFFRRVALFVCLPLLQSLLQNRQGIHNRVLSRPVWQRMLAFFGILRQNHLRHPTLQSRLDIRQHRHLASYDRSL